MVAQRAAALDGGGRQIGPVRMDVREFHDAVAEILSAISSRQPRIFAFCNMHTFNLARGNNSLAHALSKATVYNDGVGIDFASRLLHGKTFPANLNGTDLVPAVLGSATFPIKVYILGSPPGVSEVAAKALAKRFPAVRIVGSHHGYFPDDHDRAIVSEIRASGAELVLVGMGNPRQEVWAARNVDDLETVILCVGALIDFSAQRVSRAPKLVRRLRMEWLYRLALEPRRLAGRYLVGGFKFAASIAAERVKAVSKISVT